MSRGKQKSSIQKMQDGLLSKINALRKYTLAVDASRFPEVKHFIPTGCWILDHAISNMESSGGLPERRVIEIAGEFSTGKSLITGTMAREAQQKGGWAIIIDTEMSFSPDFLRDVLRVDLERLTLIQETETEAIFDAIDASVKFFKEQDIPVAIIIDSMAGLMSREMAALGTESDYRAINMHEAHKLGQLLKKTAISMRDSRICLVCVSQARDNIATGPAAWGAKKKRASSGNVLKHYTSVSVWLQRVKNIQDSKKQVIGIWLQAKIEKNNVGPPFKKLWFPVFFNRGIDNGLATLKYLEDHDLFKKSGQKIKIKFEDQELETTTRQWKQFYGEHEDLLKRLVLTDLILPPHQEEQPEEQVKEKEE